MTPAAIKRALWAECAGYCENPACRAELIRFFEDGTVTSLDELAHIIAQSPSGPRGKNPSQSGRNSFDNILVLCPSCHTLVDKNPHIYPPDLLRKWKQEHRATVKSVLRQVFETRDELSQQVERLLRRNKALFDEYGPLSHAAENPLSDAAKMWHRVILTDIIPNNRQIVTFLDANQRLMDEREIEILERFRLHAEGLEFNHVSGDKFTAAPLFPTEIYTILR